MKKTMTILLIILLSLSSCGKKSSTTDTTQATEVPTQVPTSTPTATPTQEPSEDNSSTELQTIAIDAICNDSNDIANYTPLLSGDIISKEDENTTIQIFHSQDDGKVVCVSWGRAGILREV